jgi:hypothetical protein
VWQQFFIFQSQTDGSDHPSSDPTISPHLSKITLGNKNKIIRSTEKTRKTLFRSSPLLPPPFSGTMGVGGRFWDLLKPYAKYEGIDFLRGKRVAVDLPFWIVQHDAAIRARLPHARSPHLRATFFRTVALFSKVRVLFFLWLAPAVLCWNQ